jgi:acyl-CoA thioesterase-2
MNPPSPQGRGRRARVAPPGSVDELLALFDLERVTDTRFIGNQPARRENPYSIYGGQLISQALCAASRTVNSGRLPLSLHGYFLRPGRPDSDTTFDVSTERDGQTLSTRRV